MIRQMIQSGANPRDIIALQDRLRLANAASSQQLERELASSSAAYSGDPEVNMVADAARATRMPLSKREMFQQAMNSRLIDEERMAQGLRESEIAEGLAGDQHLEELLAGIRDTGGEVGGSLSKGLLGALGGGGAMYVGGDMMSPTTARAPMTTADLSNMQRPVPQVMATEDPIDGVTYTSPQQRDFVKSLIQKGIPRGRAIELSRPDSMPRAHEMQIIRGGSY